MDMQVKPSYTPKEGRYLAFIYYYTKVNGQPPAEADMQRYFGVSAPSVHEMILRLERKGLIIREPGKARTIRNVLGRKDLPDLE
jgi:repressor LexA